MVDLLGEGEKKTKESSLGTAMCPTMHTKTKSGGGVCDSQQAAASASFNAGARALRGLRHTLLLEFALAFPVDSAYSPSGGLRSFAQCGPTGNAREACEV